MEKRKMKKYMINDDDTIRIGQTIYKVNKNNPENGFLTSKNASKDYDNRLVESGVDAEIFHNGNDRATTALMQGDIVANKLQPEIAFILISNQLMPLQEAKYALQAYSENPSPKVVKMPAPQPDEKEEHEFAKRDNRMSKDIDTLKALVDNAESQGWTTIDGVTYGASYTWREIAQLALDLADQQEWYDRYENKYED